INGEGTLDFSEAYDTGIGEWDKVAIAYGYQDFPDGANESEELDNILNQSIADGLIFISDQDARPAGGAHPLAHLWDNGVDAADELNRIMKVRELALTRFSEKNIRGHAPFATLEEVLVPIYMFHRYQVDAASKLLGGLYYTYSVRGDGQKVTEMVPAKQQRQALDALIATLKPEILALPEKVLRLIPPRAYGYSRSRETFRIRTGLTFDPLAAAETAADLTVGFIMHPARAARLIEYHARDQNYPGFIEVTDELISETWTARHGSGYHAEIRRVVDNVVLHELMSLAANQNASNQVRAIASFKLDKLKIWLMQQLAREKDERQRAHIFSAISQTKRFQEHPGEMNFTKAVDPPAGSPIGMADFGEPDFRCEFPAFAPRSAEGVKSFYNHGNLQQLIF
ncbi:MAG: zinc-dependent metalloprotease, partial [Anaerolineales bacterium]